jgi:hypothetical protein
MEKLYDFNIDCERLYQEWCKIDQDLDIKNNTYSRMLINTINNKEKYYVVDNGEAFSGDTIENPDWYSVKKILTKFKKSYTEEVCLLVEDWLKTINFSATRIKYAALYPGSWIGAHADFTGYRFHIPIITNDKCDFIVDNINYKLDSLGSIYRFNSDLIHSIANNGNSIRLHLMFDVRNLNG